MLDFSSDEVLQLLGNRTLSFNVTVKVVTATTKDIGAYVAVAVARDIGGTRSRWRCCASKRPSATVSSCQINNWSNGPRPTCGFLSTTKLTNWDFGAICHFSSKWINPNITENKTPDLSDN